MNLLKLDYHKIRSTYLKHGYVFFDGAYNINIFGVRSSDKTADVFNDVIGIAYQDYLNVERVVLYKATTDPGAYFLNQKMGNAEGTAILIPTQYRSCWELGFHNGKYQALVQSDSSQFKVWRDKNKDGVLDPYGKIYDDVTGLNCHTTSFFKEVENVGAYSAGCQVIQDDEEFSEFLSIVKQSSEMYGNSFSYTLFDEIQL